MTVKHFIEKTIESAIEKVIDLPDCVICMEQMKLKERIYTLPCKHSFHYDCLFPHYDNQRSNGDDGTCPLCRNIYTFIDGIVYDEIFELVSSFLETYRTLFTNMSMESINFHRRKRFFRNMINEIRFHFGCFIEVNYAEQTFIIVYNSMIIDFEWFYVLLYV